MNTTMKTEKTTTMKTNKYGRVIGFAGRKRSGKGMLSLGMKEYYPNTAIVTVADNLKFLCCRILGVSYDDLNRMKDDGTTFEMVPDRNWFSIISEETGLSEKTIEDEIGGHEFTNVREILQIVGSDLIRKYIPTWHIEKTIERIEMELASDKDRIVMVDDVRFPNEKEGIEAIGGTVFFVIRPNCFDVSNHPSEQALSFTDFKKNRVIVNDCSKYQMITEFNSLYFGIGGLKESCSSILLSNRKDYCKSLLNTDVDGSEAIIKKVLDKNLGQPEFEMLGIINYDCENEDEARLFHKVFIGKKNYKNEQMSFLIYNPLINEMLKKFIC